MEDNMGNKTSLLSKTIFGAIFVAFLFSQTFIGTAETKIDQIKKAGQIVVGTSADYPPYEFHLLNDQEGDLVGIDIDIAKVIADKLGVKLVIRDLIFSKIFDELEAGRIDLGIAGLTPTEERKKRVSFSEIYYQAIQSIVVNKKNTEKVKTLEDLRGKKVGIQKDSIQEDMARTQIAGAEFVVRETIEELVIVLQKSLVDAVILERPVAESYARRKKNFVSIKCKNFDNVLGSAIAVKKTDGDLLKSVNKILKELKAGNKIQEFVDNAKMLSDKR